MTTGFSSQQQPADVDTRRSQDGRTAESTGTSRLQDRVHWGPVWAGVLVALPVYLVLQLLFFALSIVDRFPGRYLVLPTPVPTDDTTSAG